MSQVGESSATSANSCQQDCPFCSEKSLLNYKTKHGDLKNERRLATNLRSDKDVTEENVGKVFPLPGKGDKTIGWEAKEGVFEDFPVKMAAAPHHIIPGKASMKPSRIETWTLESKGKIKQDIGYNIDCAQNGIFLPHIPEIYFTKRAAGTNIPMSKYYGQTWTDLSLSAKQSIGNIIMGETGLQMHYSDHDDPYVYGDNMTTYDDECKQECNHLADFMKLKAKQSKCKDGDGKLNPPYNLVQKINNKSKAIENRITGFPILWKSWVSQLAQNYTQHLKINKAPLVIKKFLINKLTK